jgi:hypothetical protein
VVITSLNPASLPPTETVTIVVLEFTALAWFSTSLVRAPEQATNENRVPACLSAQNCGYALELRLQPPELS